MRFYRTFLLKSCVFSSILLHFSYGLEPATDLTICSQNANIPYHSSTVCALNDQIITIFFEFAKLVFQVWFKFWSWTHSSDTFNNMHTQSTNIP